MRFLGLISLRLISVSITLLVIAITVAVWHPDSPLPREWNPTEDLSIDAPLTPITRIQLLRATRDGAICAKVLRDYGARFDQLPNLDRSENCHIQNRVRLRAVGDVRVGSVETRCDVALRLAMWERHGIRPAAHAVGFRVTRLFHQGSYNCRKMRTSRGTQDGWSEHATAGAIDIRAFGLADGRQLALLRHWDGENAAFLRDVWQTSCDWFRLVLSPEYNALHADHFHLQASGWGFCR